MLMLNTGMRFVMSLSISLLLDHGIQYAYPRRTANQRKHCRWSDGNAGGKIINEILHGRAGVAGGL